MENDAIIPFYNYIFLPIMKHFLLAKKAQLIRARVRVRVRFRLRIKVRVMVRVRVRVGVRRRHS